MPGTRLRMRGSSVMETARSRLPSSSGSRVRRVPRWSGLIAARPAGSPLSGVRSAAALRSAASECDAGENVLVAVREARGHGSNLLYAGWRLALERASSHLFVVGWLRAGIGRGGAPGEQSDRDSDRRDSLHHSPLCCPT